MTYKNRLYFLCSIIGALVLLYAGSYVFSYERSNTRTASFVWLDSKLAGRTSRISINSDGQSFELVKRSQQWFVVQNDIEFPARQTRVEDFIGIFTRRAAWHVRSTSASSHARLGLGETASRVTIYGENTVLLDLLLGDDDSSGREINVRRFAQNEVRSGDNSLRTYVSGQINSWYNLRLIPESESGNLDADSVQRLTIYNDHETQIFTRRNRAWTVSGVNVINPDSSSIENYIRVILNTEGDNFVDDDEGIDFFNRIVIEFGNGNVQTIRLSEPDESGRSFAKITGSDYTYSIPSWVLGRLFRDTESFERQ
ncbi:MAG: DUF4340 domain-containing protein [Treponema sp.]|jgi:hypothetical protein|nr:DUF4340 domain-containing protein [Treponema sp.]